MIGIQISILPCSSHTRIYSVIHQLLPKNDLDMSVIDQFSRTQLHGHALCYTHYEHLLSLCERLSKRASIRQYKQ